MLIESAKIVYVKRERVCKKHKYVIFFNKR